MQATSRYSEEEINDFIETLANTKTGSGVYLVSERNGCIDLFVQDDRHHDNTGEPRLWVISLVYLVSSPEGHHMVIARSNDTTQPVHETTMYWGMKFDYAQNLANFASHFGRIVEVDDFEGAGTDWYDHMEEWVENIYRDMKLRPEYHDKTKGN